MAATLVSVVMPVHNGAATIGAQLEALAAQTYAGALEVLVADNGSTDDTSAIVEAWTGRIPNLRLIDASQSPGAAYARNAGARAATGTILAFCDADDVVGPSWVQSLVEALDEADIAGGTIDSTQLNDQLALHWRPPLPSESLPVSHGFLPYALGANVAFRAEVFQALGGFREDYPAGEDVELLWRAQLKQFRFAYARDAVVHYRYRRGLRALLRQYVSYGQIGPRLYRDFAGAGMPASPARSVVGPWLRLIARLPVALLSPAARGDVLRRIAFRIGRIRGSLSSRVVYL